MNKLKFIPILLVLVFAAGEVFADKEFNRFTVFGDSLSTVTVSNRNAPGFLGSGNNWPYYMRDLVLAGGGIYENLAVGGSTSYAVLQTISGYTAFNPRLDPEGLYVVFAGINDASGYAGYIVAGVEALNQAGAGYILVSNLHECPARNPVLIRRFNDDLKAGMAGTEANVIMADTGALIRELNEDPILYGFGPEPVLTDGLHYSDWTSRIIAQYFNSVIQAPLLISLLPEFLGQAAVLNHDRLYSLIRSEREDSLLRQDPSDPTLPSWRSGDDREVVFFADGGFSSRKVSSKDEFPSSSMSDFDLLLGAYYPILDNLKTGIGLNLAYGGGKFGGGRGDFSVLRGIISLFGEFDISETVPVTVILSTGAYNLDEITREVELGSTTRKCRGSTSGSTTGIAVKTSHSFRKTEQYDFGASLGLDYEKIAVGGYTERGNQSTSMKFGSQDTDRTTGSLGLFYDYLREYTRIRVAYLIRGEYLHTFAEKSRSINARVASFDNSFTMPAYSPGNNGAVRLTLGADFILDSGFTGTCAYQLTYGETATINSLRCGFKF